MNLRLLVSILYPAEIAPHPNWTVHSVDPVAALGMLCLHHFSEYGELARKGAVPDPIKGSSEWTQDWKLVQAFGRSLFVETQPLGSSDLNSISQSEDFPVLGRAVAAVLASCAYSDMNDPEAALAVVEAFTGNTVMEQLDPLTKAVLHLQTGCRRADLDAYEDALSAYEDASVHLADLHTDQYESFELSEGSTTTSTDVLAFVKEGLADSAHLNIVNLRMKLGDDDAWTETVRRAVSRFWLTHDRGSLSSLSRWQSKEFDERIDSAARLGQRRIFSGGASFYKTLESNALAAEITGDWARAREARKVLGRDRFLQRPDANSFSYRKDGLALLLRSGDSKAVTRAVRLIRREGPLAALQELADDIFQHSSRQLGRSHLAIIRGASSLIPSEVVDSLIARVLQHGSNRIAIDAAGMYRLDDEAWSVVSALTPYVSDSGFIHSYLFDAVNESSDSLVLRRLADVASKMDWSVIDDQSREWWLEWAADNLAGDGAELSVSIAERLAITGDLRLADAIKEAMSTDAGSPLLAAGLVDIATRTSFSISDDARHSIRDLVLDAMRKKRNDAAHGSFSVGGIDVIYLATVFSHLCESHETWEEISSCLTDPLIPDSDKASSLEWVTTNLDKVPGEVRQRLVIHSGGLQRKPEHRNEFLDWKKSAAALRFRCRAGAIDSQEVYRAIDTLCSAPDNQSRLECARSLTLMAPIVSPEFVASVAMELARDASVVVRAASARYLPPLAFMVDEGMREVILSKIGELLAVDGVDIPLSVLLGLQSLDLDERETIVSRVSGARELLQEHPDVKIKKLWQEMHGSD
ncbi:hypothetical protein [Actinomadura livida]|uniref:Uncharacterized protein n=1 Tax=Actinomadura livida TaxID=79909 RepID=A0A7W7IAV3_9ACTN|nr:MULTISPECIES: hypothetical protein [Actinomadura]MBB4773624.1 hypothetical protein [Actinomadura catellatispora]GGU09592.1 hypothetical protein GCM10010208_37670 [Actinomadura livida]